MGHPIEIIHHSNSNATTMKFGTDENGLRNMYEYLISTSTRTSKAYWMNMKDEFEMNVILEQGQQTLLEVAISK